MSSEPITICTIISKNYLAHARTLADSFQKYNFGGKLFVLLVDEINSQFDPKKEKFSLVNIREIGIPNLESFCFKYSVIEKNTCAKAHFLKYLFEKFHLKKLAYFDPDILFTNSLENLWKLLDNKSIVLTPHLTGPIFDDKKPSEFDIMSSGPYNLGFLALSYTKTTRDFLNWWMPHLMEHGNFDPESGLFVDQKWIDLVPSLFDDVFIIRHPGYNVAYWNLMHRELKITDGKISVNGKPLYFFHFSGFSPENIEDVSKHQNRFTLKKIEKLRPVFELYRDLLVENGYFEVKNLKCKFAYFDNGVKIPDMARKVYSDALKKRKRVGNPFLTSGPNSFIEYLNEGIDKKQPIITRLWYKIYEQRSDLHSNFPDPLKKNREAFVKWIQISLEKEYDFEKKFMPSHILTHSQLVENSVKDSQIILKGEEFKRKKEVFEKKTIERMGINISGYLTGQFGVAESARGFVWAVKNAGIPHVLNNIHSDAHINDDNTFTKFDKDNPYQINLVIVNADQSDIFYSKFGSDFFKDKYNIAVWAWELSSFPTLWLDSQKYFDEIWVLSNFVAASLAKSLSIPVIRMTSPIEIDDTKLVRNRKKFGLMEDSFVFLHIFDFLSIFERKNPLGIVEAFKKAFKESEKTVLVIKSINGSKFPTEYKSLKKACDKKNIKFIDEHIDKNDVLSLIASSDCYVSLHKSEGTGFTMAEAMYAEKPVIATAYGGNTDFMNVNNSFLVKYRLVELEEDYGPYKKGNFWADPNVDHAASLMKLVFKNQNEAKEVARKGSQFIKQHMNSKVAGKEILTRIKNI